MNKKQKGILIYIFGLIYPFLIYGLISLLPKNIISLIPKNIIYLYIDFVLVILLLVIYKDEIKNEWYIFKNDYKNILKTNVNYWIIGYIAMVVLNIIVSFIVSKDISENEKIARDLLKDMPIYMFLASVIFAPITEEILYRKTLKNIFSNKYLYFAISGLFFGLAHVIYSYEGILDFLYVFPYAALGVSFAYMYHKTNTIFTPIAFHFIHNFSTIVLSTLVALL